MKMNDLINDLRDIRKARKMNNSEYMEQQDDYNHRQEKKEFDNSHSNMLKTFKLLNIWQDNFNPIRWELGRVPIHILERAWERGLIYRGEATYSVDRLRGDTRFDFLFTK